MDDNASTSRIEVSPFPGLASFADRLEDRSRFFGREKESQALLEMVLSESLVLLFARSGLGKTSLINAGVLEGLRVKSLFPVVVRLTHDLDRGPTQSVYECVAQQAERTGVTTNADPSSRSLWEYFNEAQFSRDGRQLQPILVLDQFEELFTIIGPQNRWRESFIKDLADLVRRRVPEEIRARETAKLEHLEKTGGDPVERERIASLLYEGQGPEVKILVSIREDFLAEMETLKSQLPTIFRNSFRLEPLEIEDARKAIELPTQQAELVGDNTFTFAPGVVDELLNFLRVQNIGGELISGDTVEPVQLQILCRHLYRQSVKKKTRLELRQQRHDGSKEKVIPEITLNDLKGRHGMKRAIVGYYHKVLKEFPRLKLGWSTRRYRPSISNLLLFHRKRSAIRYLSENKLVTPGGYRNSLSVDVIERGIGVSEQDLSKLVDERLLRTEPRLGSHFYELTHDTLIRPLVKARRKRRMYWASMLLVPLVLLIYFPGATFSRYLEIRSLKRIVNDRKQTPEERIKKFKVLLNTARYRDCSKCDLTLTNGKGMDLHLMIAYGAGLSQATLAGADLNGSTIAFSDFSKANLSGTNFTKATLLSSDFSDADLTHAYLDSANLKDADFTNAILTGARLGGGAQLENADFTSARVDSATFRGRDANGNPTSLETVWWMAIWSSNGMREMKTLAPHQDIVNCSRYQEQLKDLDYDILFGGDAVDFNSRAWFRAVRGVELDKAVSDAREARSLDPSLDRAMDTLGFILLQLGKDKVDEAISEFKESLNAREKGASDPLRIGLAHYHLALAFDLKGDKSQAQTHFALAQQKEYRPTYECLLTPPSDMASCDWPNPRKPVKKRWYNVF